MLQKYYLRSDNQLHEYLKNRKYLWLDSDKFIKKYYSQDLLLIKTKEDYDKLNFNNFIFTNDIDMREITDIEINKYYKIIWTKNCDVFDQLNMAKNKNLTKIELLKSVKENHLTYMYKTNKLRDINSYLATNYVNIIRYYKSILGYFSVYMEFPKCIEVRYNNKNIVIYGENPDVYADDEGNPAEKDSFSKCKYWIVNNFDDDKLSWKFVELNMIDGLLSLMTS